MKMNLKTLRKELRTLSEKYPIGDLWTRVFFLLDEYEAELRHLLQEFPKEIDSQDYEKGCNASFLMYSYAEIQMWLGKLKEILGEEVSE